MVDTILAEVIVPYGGEEYRLVFDWGAIEHFESITPLSFAEFVIQLVVADVGAGPMPKLTLLAAFVQAGLCRHHPGVSSEQAFQMWNDEGVRAAITGAANKALPTGEPGSAAGKRSTRAKPAARSPRRGAKRVKG